MMRKKRIGTLLHRELISAARTHALSYSFSTSLHPPLLSFLVFAIDVLLMSSSRAHAHTRTHAHTLTHPLTHTYIHIQIQNLHTEQEEWKEGKDGYMVNREKRVSDWMVAFRIQIYLSGVSIPNILWPMLRIVAHTQGPVPVLLNLRA